MRYFTVSKNRVRGDSIVLKLEVDLQYRSMITSIPRDKFAQVFVRKFQHENQAPSRIAILVWLLLHTHTLRGGSREACPVERIYVLF